MKINKFYRFVSVVLFCAAFLSIKINAQKSVPPRKAKASSTVQIGGAANNKKSVKTPVQTAVSSVKQIDADGLAKILMPNGKPLLVNFWATWCEPCRQEFPDLVKIDADYKGKIDFAVVSLDDLAEINRDVPIFLKEMKAEMPAFLLKAPNEDAVISTVSKDWQGGLPFTILYGADGKAAYTAMGKVKIAELRNRIDGLLTAK